MSLERALAAGVALAVAAALAPPPVARAAGQPIAPLLEADWTGFEAGINNAPFGPRAMATGDLDGDGDLDVFAGHDFRDGPGVGSILNHGNGSFAPPRYLLTGPVLTTAPPSPASRA